jgi:hypothetical protein
MKKSIFILTLFVALLSSCRKNDNKLSGTITYKGAITGIEYKANGAFVGLYIDQALDFEVYSTTTDSEGNYSLYPVDNGDYFMYSSITVAGILYENVRSISIARNSISTRDLILE